MSKLDLAIIAAVIVGGALWIERGHRIVIEAPAPADIVAAHAGGLPPQRQHAL